VNLTHFVEALAEFPQHEAVNHLNDNWKAHKEAYYCPETDIQLGKFPCLVACADIIRQGCCASITQAAGL
jgi:hypothetical protein